MWWTRKERPQDERSLSDLDRVEREGAKVDREFKAARDRIETLINDLQRRSDDAHC